LFAVLLGEFSDPEYTGIDGKPTRDAAQQKSPSQRDAAEPAKSPAPLTSNVNAPETILPEVPGAANIAPAMIASPSPTPVMPEAVQPAPEPVEEPSPAAQLPVDPLPNLEATREPRPSMRASRLSVSTPVRATSASRALPIADHQAVAGPKQRLGLNPPPMEVETESFATATTPSVTASRLPDWMPARATSASRALPIADHQAVAGPKQRLGPIPPPMEVETELLAKATSPAPEQVSSSKPAPPPAPEIQAAAELPIEQPAIAAAEIARPAQKTEQTQIGPAALRPSASATSARRTTRPATPHKFTALAPVPLRRSQPVHQQQFAAAIPMPQHEDPSSVSAPAQSTQLPPIAAAPVPKPVKAQSSSTVQVEQPTDRRESIAVQSAPVIDGAPSTPAETATSLTPAPARRKDERTARPTPAPAATEPSLPSTTKMIAPVPAPVEPAPTAPERKHRPLPRLPSQPEKNATPPPTSSSEPAVKRMVWPVITMEGRSRPSPQAAQIRESTPMAADFAVRVVAPNMRETGELAFTASLTPLPSETPHTSAQRSAVEHHEPANHPAQQLEHSEPSHAISNAEPKLATSSATSSDGRPAPRPAPARARFEEPSPATAHSSALATPIRIAVQTPANAPSQAPQSAPAKAVEAPEPTVRTTLETEPQTLKQAGPAREIRLELGTNDARVEVKLSDRAGELKVAVRTPDSHLAERLRADLPALSSRLEDSGLRADTWRPSAVAYGETRSTHEVSTANAGGQQQDADSRQQGREQRQRQGEPRHPRAVEENEQPKEKGKDFEWFLSATH
jgi:hypothetical protein